MGPFVACLPSVDKDTQGFRSQTARHNCVVLIWNTTSISALVLLVLPCSLASKTQRPQRACFEGDPRPRSAVLLDVIQATRTQERPKTSLSGLCALVNWWYWKRSCNAPAPASYSLSYLRYHLFRKDLYCKFSFIYGLGFVYAWGHLICINMVIL